MQMKYLIISIIFIFTIVGCAQKQKDVSSVGNESATHQKELAKDAYKELK